MFMGPIRLPTEIINLLHVITETKNWSSHVFMSGCKSSTCSDRTNIQLHPPRILLACKDIVTSGCVQVCNARGVHMLRSPVSLVNRGLN